MFAQHAHDGGRGWVLAALFAGADDEAGGYLARARTTVSRSTTLTSRRSSVALLHVIGSVVAVLGDASDDGLCLDVEHDRQTIASRAVITAIGEMRAQGLRIGG
ncbi:hypothetical protein OOK58_53970 [Streptomyces sp. NBC_01728]|uniref:hypothetical protein n=1 Tax=unclassified Streptomyces TaxID=2593676 RepID=UPI0022555AD0|nr:MULTISPECIES: hypothetical protein [unclassified Streptomyces]MCX4460694.1 hypothetical protein [Streptomyces sp. NBC_01719]MCX4499976.1 hypothetical protein [Streptomyces sp. NBC_01728]